MDRRNQQKSQKEKGYLKEQSEEVFSWTNAGLRICIKTHTTATKRPTHNVGLDLNSTWKITTKGFLMKSWKNIVEWRTTRNINDD